MMIHPMIKPNVVYSFFISIVFFIMNYFSLDMELRIIITIFSFVGFIPLNFVMGGIFLCHEITKYEKIKNLEYEEWNNDFEGQYKERKKMLDELRSEK